MYDCLDASDQDFRPNVQLVIVSPRYALTCNFFNTTGTHEFLWQQRSICVIYLIAQETRVPNERNPEVPRTEFFKIALSTFQRFRPHKNIEDAKACRNRCTIFTNFSYHLTIDLVLVGMDNSQSPPTSGIILNNKQESRHTNNPNTRWFVNYLYCIYVHFARDRLVPILYLVRS